MSQPPVHPANPVRPSFADWMQGVQAQVEAAMARCLPPGEAIPGRLHQAMRYASLSGGKRVRPLLVFAAGEFDRQRRGATGSRRQRSRTDSQLFAGP